MSRSRRSIFRAAACLATLLLAFFSPNAEAADSPISAETIKAAFLVNFVRFTDWPEDVPRDEVPYSIGISGNRQLEDALIRIANRQLVRGHRLRIVRIDNLADLPGLHVAYFDIAGPPRSEGIPLHEALPLLKSRPVLTVSDSPDFLASGGMVRIFREGKTFRFEIDSAAAKDAGLVLSSRLLALARIHSAGSPPHDQP